MTDEERKLLEMSVRGIMEKRNNHVTDADVAEAMELLLSMDEGGNDVAYQYEHPDYGAMVKEVPDILRPLLGDGGDDDGVMPYDQLMGECSKLERSTLADAASSVIYFWLDKWHKGDNNNGNDDEDDYDDEVWTYPVHMAILMIERFQLRECLPALLEMDRQQRDFAIFFFDEDEFEGMIGACIYQIATVDDLSLLYDFFCEKGIPFYGKSEVLAAVATLPRRLPQTLPDVQKWLCDVLALFADSIDPQQGNLTLLEAVVFCCIHTHCEAAKPLIVRIYSKYKMPNVMIPGGVNEVRKTIKRADIGALADDHESAEQIYMNAEGYDDDDYDDDDEDYEDYEDFDDDEDFDEDYDADDYDEEDWEPRQEYCGSVMGGKAKYLPQKSLKKYTLRIELMQSKPLVWRELEVPSNICLTSLAQAILLAMGWDEDHLHQFITITSNRKYYATSSNVPLTDLDNMNKDGSRYAASHLLHEAGNRVIFEYDYGDSWHHAVTLIGVADYAEGEEKAVRLTNGAYACPPDDCGGIGRYNHLVRLIQEKPKAGELLDFYEWMGCKWDVEYFPLDLAAAAVDEMNGK